MGKGTDNYTKVDSGDIEMNELIENLMNILMELKKLNSGVEVLSTSYERTEQKLDALLAEVNQTLTNRSNE